jgi:hypothetical protein
MRPASFRIGDMTIHRIVESEAPFMDAMEFLPGLMPEVLDEHRSWLEPAALERATDKLIFCFQSYLVRTPHHVVLIDSCVGNDKEKRWPRTSTVPDTDWPLEASARFIEVN